MAKTKKAEKPKKLLFSLLFILLTGSVFSLEFIKPYISGKKIVFSFKDDTGDVRYAFLSGSFNNWRLSDIEMNKSFFGNIYSIKMAITQGRHEYKFVVDGNWFADLANPLSVFDGFGGVNSVIYISSNGTIDWDHDEKFIWLDNIQVEDSQAYAVNLKGFYSVDEVALKFTNMGVTLSNGLVRLLETEKGVTGMVFWGEATLDLNNGKSVRGKYLFMRFNPDFFENIVPYLVESIESPLFLNCNNVFFLRNRSFYQRNDNFIIPPNGYVGISISDENFNNEMIYTTENFTYYDDPTKGMVEIFEAVQEDGGEDYLNIAKPILRSWEEAIGTHNFDLISDNTHDSVLQSFIFLGIFEESIWEEFEIIEETIEIDVPTGVRAQVLENLGVEEPFFVSCNFKTKYAALGRMRVLIGKFGDKWLIFNFELSI